MRLSAVRTSFLIMSENTHIPHLPPFSIVSAGITAFNKGVVCSYGGSGGSAGRGCPFVCPIRLTSRTNAYYHLGSHLRMKVRCRRCKTLLHGTVRTLHSHLYACRASCLKCGAQFRQRGVNRAMLALQHERQCTVNAPPVNAIRKCEEGDDIVRVYLKDNITLNPVFYEQLYPLCFSQPGFLLLIKHFKFLPADGMAICVKFLKNQKVDCGCNNCAVL